jgi:glycyl-tRNA synthetase beta chain
VVEKPGRKTSEVLAEAIPAIVRGFPWPKSQRWGAASISTESLRWVRPLRASSRCSARMWCRARSTALFRLSDLGHRFHHPGEITIGSADDYVEKLRACHVIVDHEERQCLIRAGAAKAAAACRRLVLVPMTGLVIENAGLTEWPVPMLGRFDTAFLEVPARGHPAYRAGEPEVFRLR